MKWKQFTLETKSAAEDLITDLLSELGVSSVEVRDKKPILEGDTFEIYKDVMPEQEEDDGSAEIVFYLDEDADTEAFLQALREGLQDLSLFTDIGSGEILSGETEDTDWANRWKEHFHPFYVENILIKPTWCEVPADSPADLMIEIDPGTAFGTGSHETTQLCLRPLLRYVKAGDHVLDVGTGSGILGITALKLGASFVFGTDIDPLAVETARENAELNGIPEEDFRIRLGNIIDDAALQEEAGPESYDIVVANILADIIIPLQKDRALLIVSGIINLKEEAVREALSENPEYELLDTLYQGEWVSFVARRI